MMKNSCIDHTGLAVNHPRRPAIDQRESRQSAVRPDKIGPLELRMLELMKPAVVADGCSFDLAEVVLVELEQVAKGAHLSRQHTDDFDVRCDSAGHAVINHSTSRPS